MTSNEAFDKQGAPPPAFAGWNAAKPQQIDL
jgi:hypothetical protein